MTTIRALKGTAFYSNNYDHFTILEDALILIGKDGIIEKVVQKEDDMYHIELAKAKSMSDFVELKEGQYLLPGFVDTHVHAPQWAQIGKALDRDLPTWLQQYTFPLEKNHENLEFAKPIYEHLVTNLLANGATTVQYFGSVHYEPNVLLASICAEKKQRAFIGKVVMDLEEQCPPNYRDSSAQQALQETENFLKEAASIGKETLQGIYGVVTPRFIPTCSNEVLEGLGAIAKTFDAPIQSHCSECDWAHTFVRKRMGMSDTEALHTFGLLTQKTVMAHSIFLSDRDAEIYRTTGTAISHCPISNALFANAVAPIRKQLHRGLKVSMATDISGGYSPSMFDNMRQAILSSRMLEDGVDCNLDAHNRGVPHSRMDFSQAFYMATTGGAIAMNIQAGQFKEGYLFDAFIFDCYAPHSQIIPYINDTLEDMLQKIVFLGNRQNITRLWVQGQELTLS